MGMAERECRHNKKTISNQRNRHIMAKNTNGKIVQVDYGSMAKKHSNEKNAKIIAIAPIA
jgi:hypothetical protein